MLVPREKMRVDALTQKPAANAAGETTFPLAGTTFPLAETTFPLAETTFPLGETMSPRLRFGTCLLGARTNFRFRDMFARGPNHMLPRCVHFALQLKKN